MPLRAPIFGAARKMGIVRRQVAMSAFDNFQVTSAADLAAEANR
jgi:hypothetical protein